jgi:hypothetical protein
MVSIITSATSSVGGRRWTSRPRGREGTIPSHVDVSSVWNVEIPLRSGGTGKPTARKAHCSAGTGRSEKRMPPAERHGESITRRIGFLTRTERLLTRTW